MGQYSLEQAVAVANDCARAFKLVGQLADVPYSQAQLCEVIAVLSTALKAKAEEVTLANRRYAAANAQMQRLAKKYNVKIIEEE